MNRRIQLLEQMLANSGSRDTQPGQSNSSNSQRDDSSPTVVMADDNEVIDPAGPQLDDVTEQVALPPTADRGDCLESRPFAFGGLSDLAAIEHEDLRAPGPSSEDEILDLGQMAPALPPDGPVDCSPPDTTFDKTSVSPDGDEIPPLPNISFEKVDMTPNAGLEDISLHLQDHLLDMYFRNYQVMLKLVPEAAFREQKRIGRGPAYSVSLFLSILAGGVRYSNSPDALAKFLLPDGNTVFTERAKALLEKELRTPTITTVQSLLILAEIETARGKEMTGSMYSCTSPVSVKIRPIIY